MIELGITGAVAVITVINVTKGLRMLRRRNLKRSIRRLEAINEELGKDINIGRHGSEGYNKKVLEYLKNGEKIEHKRGELLA